MENYIGQQQILNVYQFRSQTAHTHTQYTHKFHFDNANAIYMCENRLYLLYRCLPKYHLANHNIYIALQLHSAMHIRYLHSFHFILFMYNLYSTLSTLGTHTYTRKHSKHVNKFGPKILVAIADSTHFQERRRWLNLIILFACVCVCVCYAM